MNAEYAGWLKRRGSVFEPLVRQLVMELDEDTDEQWRELQFVNLLVARVFAEERAYDRHKPFNLRQAE